MRTIEEADMGTCNTPWILRAGGKRNTTPATESESPKAVKNWIRDLSRKDGNKMFGNSIQREN